MSCKFEYNGRWYSEEELKEVFLGENIIENEMGEDYWRGLYLNSKLSNYPDFSGNAIPTVLNKFKPDTRNVYHGTNRYRIDSEGNLVLTPSDNFDDKTTSISLTQVPVVAQDYMLRKNGDTIIRIKNKALPNDFTIESAEEIAINGKGIFKVKKGDYEIITVPTVAERMRKKNKQEVEYRAASLREKASSDIDLLDSIYSEMINADNYTEMRENAGEGERESAPDWYVPDEYLDSRAAKSLYADVKKKVNEEFIIQGLADRMITSIRNTGLTPDNMERALDDLSTYGTSSSPHQGNLFDSLLNEIGITFKDRDKTLSIIAKIEAIVRQEEGKAVAFYNSPEQVKKRAEEDRIRIENHQQWAKDNPHPFDDDLPFQLKGQKQSKASPVTIANMKEFLKRIGVDYQKVSDIVVNGQKVGANGISRIMQNLVEVVDGKEDVALTEEAMHFAVELIQQYNPTLYNQMFNGIGKYNIFGETLSQYRETYTKDGKPDILRIKKEAIAKLLAEYVINENEGTSEHPDLLEKVETWWTKIKEWFLRLINKTDYNPFREAAKKVLEGEIGGTITSQEGDFLQVAPNSKAEEFKKKLKEKLEAFGVRKVIDEDAVEEDDRNYYVAKRGKGNEEIRTDRTTEWAQKENLRRNGGRDYLAGASEKTKAEWAKKAMKGTEVHSDIENIIKEVTDENGMLLDDIDKVQLTTPHKTADPIYNSLKRFLLGNPSKGVASFLGQFPKGSVFLTEQVVYNEKVGKTGRAGTMDLIVVLPDGKMKVYDWKTMGFKEGKTDQAFQKRSQHALQLGDYRRTLREAYGEKDVELFTIPIGATYSKDKNDNPVLDAVKIGNVNFRDERNTFLLPVVPEDQSTGNDLLDNLIKSLRALYKRLYAKPANPEEAFEKGLKLNELAAAIRNLQVAVNFQPISVEAKNFIQNIGDTLKRYDEDSSSLSKEEQNKLIEELINLDKAASTYSGIDKVFVEEYGTENLSKEQEETLKALRLVASTVGERRKEIQERLNEYVFNVANSHGIEGILSTEKEVKGVINSFLEATTLPLKTANLLAKLVLDAKSHDNRLIAEQIREFGEIYQGLIEEAKANGKSPLEMIGDAKTLELIDETSPQFWKDFNDAREKKNKKFILDNINQEEYKKLVAEKIADKTKKINERVFSTVEDDNKRIREQKIKELPLLFNINNKNFIGWSSDESFSLIKKTIKKELHYSPEYVQLQNHPSSLRMWNFIRELNRKAFSMGYLGRGKGMSFLPLIQGTIIERLSQTNNILKEGGAITKDIYTVAAHEEQLYSKTDPETNKPIETIPKLFTHTNHKKEQLSHDLLKIVPLYIRALQEYSTAKDLEFTALAIHKVEEAKGHFELDANNNVIFKAGKPEVYEGNKTNAAIIKVMIDDAIYQRREAIDTALDVGVDKLSKGSEEDREKTKLSTKKVIQEGNQLTQALAVGLKLLVAIPNYVGAGMQAVINSGRFYTYQEYLANHGRVIGSIFQGDEGNIMKGLMDLIIPLNEDVVKGEQRKIAWKQSPLTWLGTWSFSEVLMSSNRLPDVAHQLTNAYSWVRNTMVVDGKLVNIRQHLKKEDLRNGKYTNKTSQEIRELERSLEERVKKLQESSALHKTAKFNEKGILEIPGVSREEIDAYRTRVIEFGRNVTSQMSNENKADYRRNILLRSFMMFKNWIPKQVAIRYTDIRKNPVLDEWEYGRTRLFFKTVRHIGLKNIANIRDIAIATPKGLEIMRGILEEKKEEYYKKTGHELTISEEEFFDLMRRELQNQFKELYLIIGLLGMVASAKLAAPDDDDDDFRKNRYKFWAKAANKIADELFFYYIPTSAESITNGSIFPSLGILTKASKFIKAFVQEGAGTVVDNQEWVEDAKPLKYFLNMVPVAAQFQTEILPLIDPELAKEMGIRVTAEARAMR